MIRGLLASAAWPGLTTLAQIAAIAWASLAAPAFAHDLEKTQVVVTVAADGRFTVDILNDANWLWASLAPGHTTLPSSDVRDRQLPAWTGRFGRAITLAFDGRAVAADRVEYFAPLSDDRSAIGGYEPGLMRVTGMAPAGSRALRLTYTLVVDPFPVTMRAPDGTSVTTWARAGEASAPMLMPSSGLRAPNVWTGVLESFVPAAIAIAFAALARLRYVDWSARRRRAPRRLHAHPHHG